MHIDDADKVRISALTLKLKFIVSGESYALHVNGNQERIFDYLIIYSKFFRTLFSPLSPNPPLAGYGLV
jgi:hypothetical protein